MKAFKTIETRNLEPGMILAWTGHKVISNPVAGVSQVANRMEVVVKTNRGELIQKSWNRHLLVAVQK